MSFTKSFKAGSGDDKLRLIGAGENICWASYDYEIFEAPRPEIDANAEEIQHKIMTLLGEQQWPFRQHITYDETGDRLLKVYEDVAQGAGLTSGWFVDHVETFSERNLRELLDSAVVGAPKPTSISGRRFCRSVRYGSFTEDPKLSFSDGFRNTSWWRHRCDAGNKL